MPKIEEDGKSWLRKPNLYEGVVEPYKKKIYKQASNSSKKNALSVRGTNYITLFREIICLVVRKV